MNFQHLQGNVQLVLHAVFELREEAFEERVISSEFFI